MTVRVFPYGIVPVSDRCKPVLARLKRGWGAEAINLRMSEDKKYVEVYVFYRGNDLQYRMKILKSWLDELQARQALEG